MGRNELRCRGSASAHLCLFFDIMLIYRDYNNGMAVEAVMRSAGAEETASADTSLIKDLLSRELCINTQLITVSNGEERFKAGQ